VQCVSEELLQAFRCSVGKLIKSLRGLRYALQLGLLLGLAFLSKAPDARADTIVQYCVGCSGNGRSIQVPGQSVTTPSGTWDHVAFNFYDADTGAAVAAGNLYLFTQAYTGTAVDLASSAASSPGYVATAAASGSKWIFSTSLVLSGNTQYFFYADTIPATNRAAFTTNSGYADGDRYFSGNSGTLNFGAGAGTQDYAFNLSTTNPGPLPGGGLLSYLLLGIAGLGLRFRQGVVFARTVSRRVSVWHEQFRAPDRRPA